MGDAPSEDPSRAPVDIERFDFDDDLALLDGIPFTGTMQSTYPDGTLEFLGRYRDGLPEGLNEEWYPNGQLFKRWIAVRGNGVSESWEWYPIGIQRSYRKYDENRLLVERRAWDTTGAEVDPAQQLQINQGNVLIELFDQAKSLKRADGTVGASFDVDD